MIFGALGALGRGLRGLGGRRRAVARAQLVGAQALHRLAHVGGQAQPGVQARPPRRRLQLRLALQARADDALQERTVGRRRLLAQTPHHVRRVQVRGGRREPARPERVPGRVALGPVEPVSERLRHWLRRRLRGLRLDFRLGLRLAFPGPHEVALLHFVFERGVRHAVVGSGAVYGHLSALHRLHGLHETVSVVIAVLPAFGPRALPAGRRLPVIVRRRFRVARHRVVPLVIGGRFYHGDVSIWRAHELKVGGLGRSVEGLLKLLTDAFRYYVTEGRE